MGCDYAETLKNAEETGSTTEPTTSTLAQAECQLDTRLTAIGEVLTSLRHCDCTTAAVRKPLRGISLAIILASNT